MSWINVTNLTFGYEGSDQNVFENMSFRIDTDWKTGFIGRNGKGKTTFLNLLQRKYDYRGSISAPVGMDCFPYPVAREEYDKCAYELISSWNAFAQEWRVVAELNDLAEDAEILYRPYGTLSHGERTKVQLAVLFAAENSFLLIDEPTNHLDYFARQEVKRYLASKKGFLLVSHDRDLLDGCVDHILALNKKTVEVQQGNFSSWWEQKQRADAFARAENEKHRREIEKLEQSSARLKSWADKSERAKIGFDCVKEHDRSPNARSYIGSKTKKMQSSVKNTQKRIEAERERQEGLLQDIEAESPLKWQPLEHVKRILVYADRLCLCYGERRVLSDFCFSLYQGEKVVLRGRNGSGKSTLLQAIRAAATGERGQAEKSGTLQVASNLVVSFVDQSAERLFGSLSAYCRDSGIDETLFRAILHTLGFYNKDFSGDISALSDGQKKKILLAQSLSKPAHLYLWDEPLNFLDVFSRIQLEHLLVSSNATMLIVEHDAAFAQNVAARIFEL